MPKPVKIFYIILISVSVVLYIINIIIMRIFKGPLGNINLFIAGYYSLLFLIYLTGLIIIIKSIYHFIKDYRSYLDIIFIILGFILIIFGYYIVGFLYHIAGFHVFY